MSYLRTIKIKNGEYLQNYLIFKCDKCGKELEEMHPRYVASENIDYCYECAFKEDLISSSKYLNSGTGLNDFMFKAAINPDTKEIEVVSKKSKFSWMKKNKDYRQSVQYKNWRTCVFEHDDYTCQKCGVKGGILNAHHVKSFAKYKKLRYETDNGITLCEACHRKEHSKRSR